MVFELERMLEALLFVAEGPVAIQDLCQALGAEEEAVRQGLDGLQSHYMERGIHLQQEGERVQLVTAPDTAPCIETFLGLDLTAKLSSAALETVAIIAYRQPITKAEVSDIRGVDCDGVIRTLVARGLIQELGRLDQVGRPILYGTTFEFLQYFGIAELDMLPPLEAMEEGEALARLAAAAEAAQEGSDAQDAADV